MSKQKTLAGNLAFSGKGLHTGVQVNMRILPADSGTGIVFRRTDLEKPVDVPALGDYVSSTSRGTTIEREGAKVSTIEHIMAALWTMGVDNALIEIDGPEVPIMDGSAREYAVAIAKTGLVEQDADIQYYEVRERVQFEIPERGVQIEIYPDEDFSVSVHIDYGSKVLGNQFAVFDKNADFASEIAPCRTFVFMHELEPLFEANLIKGGDIDNAIVVVENSISEDEIKRLAGILNRPDVKVNGNGYLNNIDLRFVNEPARHKLLDVLGDLALLGVRIKGKVFATKPGHRANTELVKVLKKNIKRDSTRPRFVFDQAAEPVYDINAIKRILPHRPPFLLVDKVMHIDNENVVGIKNVTMNEPFFVGHFPEEPVQPGVLTIEAMAQCGGILALHNVEQPELWSTYFLRIDGVRFKQKVVPGDQLQFELRLTEPIRRGIVVMEARAYANGELATEAQLMAQIVKNK